MVTLASFLFFGKASAQKSLIGEMAPLFSLTDQDGNAFNSKDYLGKNVLILFFYPKDESGICTKEVCSFRDSYAAFTDYNAVVVGINAADKESHKNFRDKNRLPYNLLCDPENKTSAMFGIKKKFIVVPGRETFVIDEAGKIIFHFNNFKNGEEHANQIITFLKNKTNK